MKEDSQHQLTLNQMNKVSRDLLRPARHILKISVHCSSPFKVRLFWSQPDGYETRSLLPRSRLVDGKRLHYALTNSAYDLRKVHFNG
jgi:hypothetical protein